MAIVTYILLMGLYAGMYAPSGFRPQILGETASRATLVLLFDFLFVKLGCYILNIQGSSQFVDIFSYTGYKFVGVIVIIAVGFLGISGWLWNIVFFYVFLANAFFLVSDSNFRFGQANCPSSFARCAPSSCRTHRSQSRVHQTRRRRPL